MQRYRRRFDRLAISRTAALLLVLGVPFMPALAVGVSDLDGWRSLLPPNAAWTLLAGLGLVAVAIGALTVRRPRSDTTVDAAPLGRMRDELPTNASAADDEEAEPDPVFAPSDTPEATSAPSSQTPATSATYQVPAAAPAASDDAPGSVALHHVDLSIDVLHRHLQCEPRPMPAVWLMLLDLCRTHGREQSFRELALELHRRFNVRAPEWSGFPPARNEPGLEAYPRLVSEITRAWGTSECMQLLERLLHDNRGAQRKGFTLNAYEDLIALRRAAAAMVDTIAQDLDEETKVRNAFALAAASAVAEGPASSAVPEFQPAVENEQKRTGPWAAGEREPAARASEIAREWGAAAIAVRLDNMLARGDTSKRAGTSERGAPPEPLLQMAQRLGAANPTTAVGDES